MIDMKSVVLPSENEITDRWKSEDVIVSVLCTTFNHEQYIEDAIIGFLMQITDFAFEVILHDDASTDGTTEVIKKYHTLYPKIIKPIYQEENQYSKGGFKPIPYASQFAQGQYIALCEGDDYWCDDDKLQLQFEAMSLYENLNLSFHACEYIYEGRAKKIMNSYSSGFKVFSFLEVVQGGGAFIPTASIMVKKEVFNYLIPWIKVAPVGDLYIQMVGSIDGGALFIPKLKSGYTVLGEGSWTKEAYSISKSKIEEIYRGHLIALDNVSDLVGVNRKSCIDIARAMQAQNCASMSLNNKHYKTFQYYIEESYSYSKNLSKLQGVMFLLKSFPSFLYLIKKIARYFKL